MIDSTVAGSRSLVVGAGGQVGAQMASFLERKGEDVLPTARLARPGWLCLDLAALADMGQVASVLGDVSLRRILCLGGMTNVDACEDSPEIALRTNARGPGLLARYASELGIPFVYFSTEYVFDGSAERPGPYVEEDVPKPLNVYGKSKLDGERAVLEANPAALVVRTTVVYGPDPGAKNYLYALMRNLSEGREMRVPVDQVSTPTYNLDLVSVTTRLMDEGAAGVFHVCGPELLPRLAFARAVAGKLGLDETLLRGVSTGELGQRARRPLAAGLSTKKLNKLYPDLRMHTVAEALDEAAAELKTYLDGKV